MKRFLKKLALFAAIVISIDVCYGLVMGYMNDHAKGGGMQKRLYVAKQSEDNIMMFGSSRMKYHYNPMIVEDSLGVTCFNAGEDQSGIILSYGFLTLMLERYTPEMVVYDASCYDYMVEDIESNLKYLKPYYGTKCIRDYFCDLSPENRLKMMCSLYRYNAISPWIIGCFIKGLTTYQKGYIPMGGTMDYDVDTSVHQVQPIDDMKMKYLRLFIQKCKENHISLVFCVSPAYKTKSSELFAPVRDVCRQEGIPFLDHYCDEDFVFNKEYFNDQTHLNGKGADAFTRKLVGELRHYLQ